jgi:hypothetical protein
MCCVSFDRGVILCDVLFVCCVLLYNHCHRVQTHLQLINITLIQYTVGRTPWTEDQPSQGSYLHTEQHKDKINAHRHTCLEWDSNPRSQRSSERAKTVHALDRAVTVIGIVWIWVSV